MDRQYRYTVVRKLEKIVGCMQHVETGVSFRSQKLFLTSIPAAVAGSDIISWLSNSMQADDMTEACHLANLLCTYGYIYPLADYKSHLVKDDPTVLYRFQAPYFWLSKVSKPDAMDYAIYLVKRTMRGRQRYSLEEYEQSALEKLQKMLCDKWEFIYMQAEEQVRLGKERKKGDRIVIDVQERAFWRIHRPPPGRACKVEEGVPRNTTPSQMKVRMATKARRVKAVASSTGSGGGVIPGVMDTTPEKTTTTNSPAVSNTVGQLRPPSAGSCMEAPTPSHSTAGSGSRAATKAMDNLISFQQQKVAFDWFLDQSDTCNYWLSNEANIWPADDHLVPTFKQVRIWGSSFDCLLHDPIGRRCISQFLVKEFSGENMAFWTAVNAYKFGPVGAMATQSRDIFAEFLASGAPSEINIDSKTMAITERELKTPSRFTFEEAQEHIYNLMKKDSFARFLRSEDYAASLQAAHDRYTQALAGGRKRAGGLFSSSPGDGATGAPGTGGTQSTSGVKAKGGTTTSAMGGGKKKPVGASPGSTTGGIGADEASDFERQSGNQPTSRSISDIQEATGPKSPLRSNAIAPWEDEE